MRKRNDGFTLVELMVVVLIIGILVAVAVPVFRAARTTAEKNTCQSFQRTWAGVVEQAKANGDERGGAEASKTLTQGQSAWYDVAVTYLKSVPTCPTSNAPYWVYQAAAGTPGNGELVGCAAGSVNWASGHLLGDGSLPGSVIVWEGITYKVIVAEDGRLWLDRNLGATQVATSMTDLASYGWYYQWGRGTDGHQIPSSASTTTVSTAEKPGHGLFIDTDDPYEWTTVSSANLWTSASGTNNPCPPGFHVPNQGEWANWISKAGVTDTASAFDSKLKLPCAGYRSDPTVIYGRDTLGRYWSSTNVYTHFATQAYRPLFLSDIVYPSSSGGHDEGSPVRAIKNQ